MAIGTFTLQQLKDGCRMGMLDSWGQQVYRPDYKTTFEDNKENLDYVIVNRHQFNSINARYLHFKRDEIRTGIIKDAIPYSTRLGNLCGEDIFIIQQLDFDHMSAKIVGTPQQIAIIRGHIRDNNTFEGLTDDEFWEMHRRDLDAYRNIPEMIGLATLSMERDRFVKGSFNQTPEKFDQQGLHVTQIDDYDNYKYTIYGVSHESYNHTVYVELKRKRNEERAIYYEEKLEDWKESIVNNANRIYKIMSSNKEFVEDLKEYNFRDGSRLSDEKIMTDLCKEHGVSFKGGWATWKFLNINDLEQYIESEEYLEYNNDIPYVLNRSGHSNVVNKKS